MKCIDYNPKTGTSNQCKKLRIDRDGGGCLYCAMQPYWPIPTPEQLQNEGDHLPLAHILNPREEQPNCPFRAVIFVDGVAVDIQNEGGESLIFPSEIEEETSENYHCRTRSIPKGGNR